MTGEPSESDLKDSRTADAWVQKQNEQTATPGIQPEGHILPISSDVKVRIQKEIEEFTHSNKK